MLKDDVYNRALFSKKSQEARKTLRDMGGVPSTPPSAGGILASSPELIEAAMRRPVVLPTTQTPVTPTPTPTPPPVSQALPPSSPLPNVAGIPSTAPAPRSMAQKPGVKKMANGGDTFLDHYKTPALMKALEKSTGTSFDKAFEFGQKAITTEDPRSLGLPVTEEKMAPVKQVLQNPEVAAAGIIEDTVPEDQRTGDLNKDLRTAARAAGITRVPAEAEIDQLNTAIMGAKLGAAIAGSYVDPNTGQELRPTAGARIGQAVAEGLAFRRDTETRRAKQEAELAKAQIAARARTAGKTGKGWFDTAEGKYFTKLVQAALPLVGGSNISEAYDRVAQEHPELVARARMEISNMGLDTSANPPPEGNVNMSSPETSANPPPEGNVAKDTRSGKIVGDSPFYVGQKAIHPVTGEVIIYTESGWPTPMKTN